MRSTSVNEYISEITVTIKLNEKELGEEGGIEMKCQGKAEVHVEAKRPLVSGYSYYGTVE